jgi:hypothetical protein
MDRLTPCAWWIALLAAVGIVREIDRRGWLRWKK